VGVELFKHPWHSPLGLAKLRGAAATLEQTVVMALANEGTSMGTFQCMPSEQLEGKDADDCTDACSFGSVFYEMITEPLGALREKPRESDFIDHGGHFTSLGIPRYSRSRKSWRSD